MVFVVLENNPGRAVFSNVYPQESYILVIVDEEVPWFKTIQ